MKKKKVIKNYIIFIAAPFIIPFIQEISDVLIHPYIKWTIIILAIIIYLYQSYKLLKEEKVDEKKEFVQSAIRYAYSSAHELMEQKRDILSHDVEFNNINLEENILAYDIHLRIIDICKQFRNVIASTTKIDKEYISCTLIYRYFYDGCEEDDEKWKWAGGRDPINQLSLNEFVQKPDTSYFAIINGQRNFVFGNDKEKLSRQGLYKLSNRDRMYGNRGSAFSIKVAFGNNARPLVEGILTVSTYGKSFTENMNIENSADVFERIIIDEIFPYYKKLIEMEFGMLYVRHINIDKKKKDNVIKDGKRFKTWHSDCKNKS